MYKSWDKNFYPNDLKNEKKLSYISKHYKTLEVNTTFYHFVKKDIFRKWYDETTDNFIFSIKAPRFYTHLKRLKIDDEMINSVRFFLSNIQELKEKLWSLLIQLPESFKENKDRLELFFGLIAQILDDFEYKPDIAIEFRDSSWFKEEIYDLLKKFNVALVIANSSRYPYVIKTTADFSYMRFHWPERMFLWKYSEDELKYWKSEIDKFSKNLKKVYVYFNNDLDANAVENADFLMSLFNANS